VSLASAVKVVSLNIAYKTIIGWGQQAFLPPVIIRLTRCSWSDPNGHLRHGGISCHPSRRPSRLILNLNSLHADININTPPSAADTNERRAAFNMPEENSY